jgi:hypothetical protein
MDRPAFSQTIVQAGSTKGVAPWIDLGSQQKYNDIRELYPMLAEGEELGSNLLRVNHSSLAEIGGFGSFREGGDA